MYQFEIFVCIKDAFFLHFANFVFLSSRITVVVVYNVLGRTRFSARFWAHEQFDNICVYKRCLRLGKGFGLHLQTCVFLASGMPVFVVQ